MGLVATHTAAVTSGQIAPGAFIQKLSGSTARTLRIDYIRMRLPENRPCMELAPA